MAMVYYLIISLSIFLTAESHPHHVRTSYYHHRGKQHTENFQHGAYNFQYWNKHLFPVLISTYSYNFNPNFKQKTYPQGYHNVRNNRPNYNEVYDPHFLTGEAAYRAAAYLYSKELFFNDIPHLRAILNNRDLRRLNGLPDHKLSSLRINFEIPEARYH